MGYGMAQSTTPVVQQRRLRAELRRARDERGLTQKQVAEQTGWSISRIIRLETGATAVSTSDVLALVQLYGIKDKAQIDDMIAVTRAQPEAWWDKYSEHYRQQFINFLAYEDGASVILQFQAHMVPGLLQTRDYANGVFEAYLVDPGRIDRAWEVRDRRQRLLQRDNVRFDFLLDEAVLHRTVVGPDVMIAQLVKLKELNDRDSPSLSIRVVPYSAGVTPGMKGSFTIFEYSSEDEDFVVNVEEPKSDVLVRDNPEETSKYVEAFLELEAIALPKADTNEMLGMVIESLRASQPG